MMRAPAFWYGDAAWPVVLAPASALFTAAGRLRRRLARPARAPIPVICIGNLVAGGAGKTPVALSVAECLIGRGVAVHFLSGGYGGRLAGPVRVVPGMHEARDVGDEPLLLARTAPCWIARDRAAGAEAAVHEGAQVIVMDDGFQNPGLRKSASILVVDGETGFGNGRVMPAGPLREPVADGLARASAVALLGEDGTGIASRLPAGMPLLRAVLEPVEESRTLEGERVVAFAGIGRPEKFFATLEAIGCKLAETRSFPDHHPYTRSEVQSIVDLAWKQGALPVTTEKDAVRVPPELRALVMTVGIRVVWDDPKMLDRVLWQGIGGG